MNKEMLWLLRTASRMAVPLGEMSKLSDDDIHKGPVTVVDQPALPGEVKPTPPKEEESVVLDLDYEDVGVASEMLEGGEGKSGIAKLISPPK